jgi:hypothetical protein
MRRRMHRRWHTVSLMAALSCVFMTACVKWPDAEVSATQHDKLLFERATSAVEQGRFTVANLTLQTLINTYPDSEYASKPKQVLEDPRIGPCDPPTRTPQAASCWPWPELKTRCGVRNGKERFNPVSHPSFSIS